VIADASEIRLVTGHKFLTGRVVKVDTANDLALLKTEVRLRRNDGQRIG
jgi:S1-C subfamily serine protease